MPRQTVVAAAEVEEVGAVPHPKEQTVRVAAEEEAAVVPHPLRPLVSASSHQPHRQRPEYYSKSVP